MARIEKTDAEWRATLTPRDYEITRRAGTEPPFTGIYWNTKTPGVYNCKCCDAPLFDSRTKYDSGCRLAELLPAHLGGCRGHARGQLPLHA